MSASNFTLTPNAVIPIEPVFYGKISEGGMDKQFNAISSDGTQKFELQFKLLTNTQFQTLYNHYYECKGDYDSFSWTTVPDYLSSITNYAGSLTGRWVKGSFSFTPLMNEKWQARIIFELEV